MKKILGFALFAALLTMVSCGSKLSKSDVESAFDGTWEITANKYLDLSGIYAAGNDDDTTGFYQALVDIIEYELGYPMDSVIIRCPGNKTVIELERPLTVDVFLDNSSSMQGYYSPSDKASIAALSQLFAAIESRYTGCPINGYYAQGGKKGTQIVSMPFSELSTKIVNKALPYSDAYQFNDVISAIADSCAADSVYNHAFFFITDGILSGTNAEIAKNPKFNMDNASLLRNRVADAFRPLRESGYGVGVYEFDIHFAGDYYNYKNGKTRFNGMRPLYVIAIAPADVINALTEDVEGQIISDFSPNYTVSLTPGAAELAPTVYPNHDVEDGVYNLRPSSDDLKTKKSPRDGEQVLVAPHLTFSLTSFPSYMQSLDAIKGALVVKKDNAPVSPETYRLDGNSIIVPFEMGAHETATVTYELTDAMPSWIALMSTNDDTDVNLQPGTTFNLEYLVGGLKQAIYGNTTNRLVAPVKLEFAWDGSAE